MQKPDQKGRGRRTALLLLLVLLAFFAYRWIRTDPNVRKIRAIEQELAAATLSQEERGDKMRQLREAMDKLNPKQRESMRKELSDDRRRRSEEQMKRYAQMSPADRERYLDQQIERMQNRRNRQGDQNDSGAAPGANDAPGGAATGRNQGDQNGPARGVFGNGGGGQDGTAAPRSSQDREAFRKQMLDATTPEFRSWRDQYRQDLRARMQQQGYAGGFGRFGPGR